MTISFLAQPSCCLVWLSQAHGSRQSREGSCISLAALKFSARVAYWVSSNSTSASALSCSVQPGMEPGKLRPSSAMICAATDCCCRCSGARKNGTATLHQHLCGVACNPPHMFHQANHQIRTVSVSKDSPVSLGENVPLFSQSLLQPS